MPVNLLLKCRKTSNGPCNYLAVTTGVYHRIIRVTLSLLYSPVNGPVFSLELVLDSEGAHYNTDLTEFIPMLVEVFNRGIQSTHSVPQLEKVPQSVRLLLFHYCTHLVYCGQVILAANSFAGVSWSERASS